MSPRNGARALSMLLAGLSCLGGCSAEGPTVAVGTLERDRYDLIAEASEPVVVRAVEEGAYVERGALIVGLDRSRLEAQLAQLSAGRDAASARLAELERGPRPERIAETRARLRGADGQLETARADLARAKSLVARGVVSEQQIDQRRAHFDEALAARDAARATLEELLEGTTLEELDQAEASVAQTEAALTDARIRLERLDVRAPVAGWVDALPYELGERPPAGGVVVVLLAERAPYARVYVPAAIRTAVAPGVRARVHVDGIVEPLDGIVRHVAKDASFTPYFALTERDRGRLVYLAKVDLVGAGELPTGVPVEVVFDAPGEASWTPDGRTGD